MKTKDLILWLENTFNWQTVGITVAVLVGLWIIAHFGVKLVIHLLLKVQHFSENVKLILTNLVKPIGMAIYTWGGIELLSYLGAPQPFIIFAAELLVSALAISVGLALYHLIPALMMSVSKVGKDNIFKNNAIIRSFLTTILQVVMWACVLIVILAVWHINVNGILAGAGLTGVAISMAAQDQIRNFLGGVVIIGERSFGIGDKVESPSIQGTVEDITFRSTKLRTATGTLQVVPNSTLANEPITNVSQLNHPQIQLDYYLDVKTTKNQIEQLRQRLNQALKESGLFVDDQQQVNFLDISQKGCHLQVGGPLSKQGQSDQNQTKLTVNLLVLDQTAALDVDLVQTASMTEG
ncbi:MscS family membrane protein [Weissella uvarum]|uniref:mechanosensitive ion channel family protein n=1 Tax=Weissella uvarum TaxID=1479233 RepID=UPI001960D253|nr:mechanosensitive ion channel family protein [Weissella uvarum]MBM7617971.1 MscS family membrane protein [Weissella uvarum]MCM0596190.1 mechanosensitive ion channel family protein [Weissella uvarum]